MKLSKDCEPLTGTEFTLKVLLEGSAYEMDPDSIELPVLVRWESKDSFTCYAAVQMKWSSSMASWMLLRSSIPTTDMPYVAEQFAALCDWYADGKPGLTGEDSAASPRWAS